jgi:ketosteroid isomerase-like protein
MSYKTAIVSTVLMLSFVLVDAQTSPDEAERTLQDFDQKLEATLTGTDVAALEQMLAPDYIQIDPQGRLTEREQILAVARARKAAPKAQSVGPEKTVQDQTIRIHGDIGIVVTLISTKYQFMDYQTAGPPPAQGPEVVDQERRLRVYFRKSGRWQLVAQQTTAVAKR